MKTLTLTKDKLSDYFKNNKEHPYWEIEEVIFTGNDIPSFFDPISLVLNCYYSDGFYADTFTFTPTDAQKSLNPKKSLHYKLNKNIVFNTTKYDKIELKCSEQAFNDISEIKIIVKNRLDIYNDNFFYYFKEHIDDQYVNRTLFSAKFGQGKTTFLKEFFKAMENEYEVFHLFPVNYSLSTNSDIFQYIKCELLFQLLGKDITLEENHFSNIEILPFFLQAKGEEVFIKRILPLLKIVPKVGITINEAIVKLVGLKNDFEEFKKTVNIDEQEEVSKYIEAFYEQEGSIYEDNFFTQLIRQQIEVLKEKGKKTVLIIDDLDRMDPEHIFRILNVFAAHFDSHLYQSNHSENKFGFDKIIIVSDYNNLKKIFAHRYGGNTDFKGYLDKFFSKKVWYFDGKALAKRMLNTRLFEVPDHIEMALFSNIVDDLISTESISLREIFKLMKQDFLILKGFHTDDNSKIVFNSPYFKFPLFIQIYYLSEISGIDNVIDMFTNCKENLNCSNNVNLNNQKSYESFCLRCLISLNDDGSFKDEEINIIYKENNISFSINKFYDNFGGKYYIIPDNYTSNYKFTGKDFYSLLIEVAKKFKEVGGF